MLAKIIKIAGTDVLTVQTVRRGQGGVGTCRAGGSKNGRILPYCLRRMDVFPTAAITHRTIEVSEPSAGAEFSYTIPASDAGPSGMGGVLLKSVSALLTQGATQTPWPALVLDDGTNVVAMVPGASAAQTAGEAVQYTWLPGGVVAAIAGSGSSLSAASPLPAEAFLLPGYRIRSVTAGIGANSQFSAVTLLVAISS